MSYHELSHTHTHTHTFIIPAQPLVSGMVCVLRTTSASFQHLPLIGSPALSLLQCMQHATLFLDLFTEMIYLLSLFQSMQHATLFLDLFTEMIYLLSLFQCMQHATLFLDLFTEMIYLLSLFQSMQHATLFLDLFTETIYLLALFQSMLHATLVSDLPRSHSPRIVLCVADLDQNHLDLDLCATVTLDSARLERSLLHQCYLCRTGCVPQKRSVWPRVQVCSRVNPNACPLPNMCLCNTLSMWQSS